ncbi:hypothetical protein AM588_10010720 [Phytophthora nicotianae]|uniref:rRNA biogenesis protein RRP5 n=1 Tax=Phytophthora nicotianae TaxID=4792 RepID=A0A0W8DSU2_PHYNI|nr:hypothetical protein AM588_10010720 [Phytophthora nicotianae]
MAVAAAATSFPRGRKPKAPSQKASTSVAAPGEALFGKRGLAVAAEEQPKKKAKKAVKSEKTGAKDELKAAKATLLSFKTLRKGMLLLGCVRQVTDGQDLMISLPNKLNGTVALSECSDEFHEFLQTQKKAKQQDEEEEQLQPLSTIFKVGQFVPCVVLATGKTDKRKQIQLSLRTSLIHAELSPSSLTKGASLHATVSSVEDHGAIVNLGIRGVHAFVPRKELATPVHKGQHLLVNVVSMNTHTNTATVTIDRSQVVKAVTRGDSFTLKQLVPGMLLNVRVEDVLENGLSVTFLTFFTATVEQNHMSLPCERGWEESYRKGMKARARIISIDYIAKQITLSMAPHVVHMQVPESLFSVGDIIEEATIERIDAGVGMLLSLKNQDEDVEMGDASDKKESTTNAKWKAFAPGYVHISNVSDKRVDKLEKKFTVGSSIKCRVLGFSPFDAVASVSCKEHSISQTVLRHKDLKPGTKVNGKILSVESWGILMEISEGVRGLVTPQHMPAFLLNKKANNGKYKVGKTANARVLHVDLDANKTYLTMKSGLLSSDLPVLSSFQEATMGLIAHGFITKIGEYGVIVTFYNNVYGLVPMAVLQQAGIENLEEAYVLGQVVKARVTRCDPNRKRLMLSFDTTSNSSSNKPTAAPETASKLVGMTITNVKITDVETTCFRVQTKDGMEGVLPFVQLTDFPRNTPLVDEIVKRFSAGDVISEPLLVVSQESDGVLTLSKKPLLLEFASRKAIVPRTFGDVQENAVLIGYVTSVNVSKGVFVKFLNNVVAVAPKGFLKEQFVAQIDEGMFEIGETVTCSVEKINKEKKQFVVGFQQSSFVLPTNSTNKARPAFFQAYLREQASVRNAAEVKKAPFALGKTEKAEFVGVRPYGAVFALEKDEETVTVLVPSVTENKEWDEGDSVKLLLTDYDFSKNVYYGAVDESLVKSGSKKSRKQKQRVKAGGKIAAASVLAVSPTEKYAVVSFPDPQNADLLQFGVVQLCDFWCPSQTSSQLGIEVAPMKKHVKKSKPVAMEIDLGDDESSSEEEDASSAAPVEFSWDGFSNALSKKTDSKDDDESSSDEEDEEEATNSSKASKKNRLQSDEWVALREKALASNEESSYLWIQFMAFHVSLTEIDLARDVAVRATSAVSFRDEKEKLNVWVAYLNLEHDFGDDASFLRVFKSALQVNHPKRVYLHLVDLYARAEEHEDVKQTLATMHKKFRTSKQTWIRSLQYLVGEKQFAEAAETLQRSLKSLAAHKHLPVILKYGQLLYEQGELDKARTIFEGILANYPKRMDLWNVYLDKEIKFGDVALVRALFERLLAMDFSAKKMKFLFKKYLQFEQDQGDDEHVEHVKQLAKDFVASAAAK